MKITKAKADKFRKNYGVDPRALNEAVDAQYASGKKEGRKGFKMAGMVGRTIERGVAGRKAFTSTLRKSNIKYGRPADDGFLIKDKNFFGHSKVGKRHIVKNPPPQPNQLGKDGFYGNVKNVTGKL
jgi:hypothetical protein